MWPHNFGFFSKLERKTKRQVRFRKFFVCDLLTPHGFSGRNFVRCVICTLKAWLPYNRNGTCGTGGSVQGRIRLRYLLHVPGTLQSAKRNLMSLCWSGVLHSSLSDWLQKARNKQFCQCFLLGYRRLDRRRNQVESKHKFWIRQIF